MEQRPTDTSKRDSDISSTNLSDLNCPSLVNSSALKSPGKKTVEPMNIEEDENDKVAEPPENSEVA